MSLPKVLLIGGVLRQERVRASEDGGGEPGRAGIGCGTVSALVAGQDATPQV
jgi:hypothetical protein